MAAECLTQKDIRDTLGCLQQATEGVPPVVTHHGGNVPTHVQVAVWASGVTVLRLHLCGDDSSVLRVSLLHVTCMLLLDLHAFLTLSFS